MAVAYKVESSVKWPYPVNNPLTKDISAPGEGLKTCHMNYDIQFKTNILSIARERYDRYAVVPGSHC